jgi:hypothetical protein
MGLTVVQVPRQHDVHPKIMWQILDKVRIMGQQHTRHVVRNPRKCLVRADSPVRKVVDSTDGEHGRFAGDQDVLIQEHTRAPALERFRNGIRIDPMVVIAQDRQRAVARLEACDDLIESA